MSDQSKKVAVVLSGCGVLDGAEIHESVITLLRLCRRGAQVTCFAPNMAQAQVINHLNGKPIQEERNVLAEAARIARGEISDLKDARAEDFDALVVPGGFGAAKNLCDFAFKGSQLSVQPDFLRFAQGFAEAAKPVGLICISPVMAAPIYGPGVEVTIGKDAPTANAIEQTGAVHKIADVRQIVEDQQRRLVTTPAYMLGQNIAEVADGIEKLVDRVLELT